MSKIINKQPSARECFVCGTENNKGLHASFYETDTNEIEAVFTPHRMHQSYPGRLHGGIAACILDETIGRAVQIEQPDIWGVTAQLTVSYKKPLPYGEELKALGRITKQSRLLFEGEGEIYTSDGQIAVTAKAKYFKMRIGRICDGLDGEDWKLHIDSDEASRRHSSLDT
ncbi:MAG: PaaI family thioesterase [Christensenellales bacterium]